MRSDRAVPLLAGLLTTTVSPLASPAPATADGSRVALPEVAIVEGHPIRTVLPPDAIRALDRPAVAAARDAAFMAADEPVLGVVLHGVPRAYPIRQLDWHEVVNDRLGGRPIAVSW